MRALLCWLGVVPEPGPRSAALAAQCDLLLELARRHPERVAALGRQFAAAGVTTEEASRALAAFARMSQGDLTTR